jgi:hypothetical protein
MRTNKRNLKILTSCVLEFVRIRAIAQQAHCLRAYKRKNYQNIYVGVSGLMGNANLELVGVNSLNRALEGENNMPRFEFQTASTRESCSSCTYRLDNQF